MALRLDPPSAPSRKTPKKAPPKVRRKPARAKGGGVLGAAARAVDPPARRSASSSPLRQPLAIPPGAAPRRSPGPTAPRRVVASGRVKVKSGARKTGKVPTKSSGPSLPSLSDVAKVSALLGGPLTAAPVIASKVIPKGARRAVDRELSGKGSIARTVARLAENVGEGGLIASTGGGPAIGPAVIGAKRGPAAGALAPKVVRLKDAPPILGRGVKDLVNLPAVAVPSLYVPIAAAAEAAMGRAARGKQLLRELPETDPVVALATGNPKKALALANEHPGFAALEVAGLKGAAGRGAGRGVRGTGKVVRAVGRTTRKPRVALAGEAIRVAGAVETRPNARVPGTALVQDRQYSPDITNKAVQIARDKRGAKAAVKLRAKAARAPDPDVALRLRQRANSRDPAVANSVDVRRRVNLLEPRAENTRRRDLEATDRTMRSIRKDFGDKKGAAPVLVATGITPATASGLRAYRNELAAVHSTLASPAKRAANARMRQQIDVSLRLAAKRTPKGTPPRRAGTPDPALARVLAAAKRYSAELDKPLDTILSDMGILDAERGTRAKLIPVAAREAGATLTDTPAGRVIVDRSGAPMSTAELRAVAGATREVDPSYVSQAANATGAQAYYRSAQREPAVSSSARSERPTLEGTFDASPEALRARALASTGMASAAKNFRDFISETGLRDKGGGVRSNLTRAQAMRLREDIQAESGHEFVPVAVRPWAATREHIDAMMNDIDALGDFDPRTLDSFRESLSAALRGEGDGPFTLVPAAAAKQAEKFLKIQDPTDAGRMMRALRSSFSRTVLTTSPGPTFGNVVEPTVRALVQRAGPLSTYRGVRVRRELRRIDPKAAADLDSVIGRGQVTLAAKRTYVDPRQFDPGPVRNIVAGWQAFKRAPGGKQFVGAWDLWTRVVFEQVNGRVERYLREGPMLGKVLKDSGVMDHTLMALSNKAMREAAEGLRGTAAQARVAAKLNDSYGKYQGFSPAGQKAIAEYTPFAAWWLSAATFVGKVLPRDHPALLALTASAAQATEDWRKARGLDLFQGEGKLPGWLQGTIDTGGNAGRVKAAYNTPFGAFTDPLNAAGSLVFPQGENLLKAFQGLDWKNKALRNDDGTEFDETQKALYAVGELLKSTVPAVAVPVKVKRYKENPRALLNPVLIPPAKPRVRATRSTDSVDAQINRILNNDPVQDQIDRLLDVRVP